MQYKWLASFRCGDGILVTLVTGTSPSEALEKAKIAFSSRDDITKEINIFDISLMEVK